MVASRPFRPAGRPGSAVLAALAGLWDQAAGRMAGGGKQKLTQKLLAAKSGVPESTVSSWATGASLPQDPDQLVSVGAVLAGWAGQEPPGPRQWARLLEADKAARGTAGEGGPGRLVAELRDPFALKVHPAIEIAGPAGAGLPALPPYIKRDHDAALAQAAGRAAAGRSVMAVLVGGSSTGKTRACWEALSLLPAGWRLWHPYDPTWPEAALAGLPQVRPRTVIWLNETQHYLDAPGDTGDRVAAALRTLLTDPGRAPVLVLGTLWRKHWDDLTGPDTGRPQARILLEGTSIPVPDAFTGPELQDLQRAGGDPRLAAAAAGARDGQVTQYLAGVPELLARYDHAPPAARALIHAAMDARRLGHGIALPHDLLEAAAAAYLTDADWEDLDEAWLEQALAYTRRRCQGVPGPLTRIRPRPGGDGGAAPASRAGPGLRPGGPAYRLADYLDQHGRGHRSDQIPPPGLWAAAARHAQPADQAILGEAARGRGLYRHAAQLLKNAASHGNPLAAATLLKILHELRPADKRPARWVVGNVPVDGIYGITVLVDGLREVGADQVTKLAGRATASAFLDDPYGMAAQLDATREAGAGQEVTDEVAGWAAAHASLDDPYGVARLLDSLREAGAVQQVAELVARDPAAYAPLDDLYGVAVLLDSLRAVGADQQAAELARRAGADPQVIQWRLGRIQTRASPEDFYALVRLLVSLREAGADQQAAELAGWSAPTSLSDPYGVAMLLDGLRGAGADQQAAELVARDPAAHACLDDPYGVAVLLDGLREAGADQQVAELVARDPAAHASLSQMWAVARLLDSLRAVGAVQQVAGLADRLPAAGMFILHPEYGRSRYRFGREPDGGPAPAWDWTDLD